MLACTSGVCSVMLDVCCLASLSFFFFFLLLLQMDPKFLRNQRYAKKHNNKVAESE